MHSAQARRFSRNRSRVSALDGLEVTDETVDAAEGAPLNCRRRIKGIRTSAIAIAPHWHRARPVRTNIVTAIDRRANAGKWKPPSGPSSDGTEIRRRWVRAPTKRPVASTIDAVARHAGKFVFRQTQMVVRRTHSPHRKDKAEPCHSDGACRHHSGRRFGGGDGRTGSLIGRRPAAFRLPI